MNEAVEVNGSRTGAEVIVERFSAKNAQQWDAFVEQHPAGTAYHKMAWLQTIEQAYQFQPVMWAVKNNLGEILGIFACVAYGWPLKKLCSLPYCDVGGPLAYDPAIEMQLLLAAKDYAQTQNLRYAEVRRSIELENPLECAKVRMLLALPATSDELLAGFKSKLRSQINKSIKNGLQVVIGREPAQVAAFFQVYARNMRDLGSPPHSQAWFTQLISHYQQDAMIATVWHEQTCIGAGLILRSGERWSIPWASTVQEYNSLAPNMLLYWELLRYCCDHGATLFDFGRSTPGEGTFKFKAQWGAVPMALDWQVFAATDNWQFAPPELVASAAQASATRERLSALWAKFPVGLSTLLGRHLRKFITL